MAERFPVVDVSAWAEADSEAMGSKPKVWLKSPADDHWLFKQVVRGVGQAEDWPEKVASEIATIMGIPAAFVEFATYRTRRGVVSLSVTQGHDLVHGNELLYGRDPTYEKDKPRPDRGYSLTAVRDVLAASRPPAGANLSDFDGYDVFASYLLFDALIANQDRHHENWGVLVDPASGDSTLAPSFDHASSLGYLLTDSERSSRLTTGDRGYTVERWASRAKSHLEGRPNLIELAGQALSTCSNSAAAWWLNRLDRLQPTDWEEILMKVPDSRVSDLARTFASEVLTVNHRRLLDVCSRFA